MTEKFLEVDWGRIIVAILALLTLVTALYGYFFLPPYGFLGIIDALFYFLLILVIAGIVLCIVIMISEIRKGNFFFFKIKEKKKQKEG